MKNKIVRTVLPVGVLVLFSVMSIGCPAQENQSADSTKRIGGPFENAEYFYHGMPENPESTHTSRGWSQSGPKLVLTGTVYQRDGKTPASGIVLYYYHTGTDGLYSNGPGADKRALRHGYLRGWVKSDAEGKYTIRTIRPAAYPNEKIPAHIHFAVKEPNLNEYYVDDVVFDDDPLLTAEVRKAMEDRAGSGIVQLKKSGDTLTAQRDFILGLNIPDYPAESATKDNKTTDAKLIVPPVVIEGKNPGIEVGGLNANEVVRIHVLRSMDKWKEENGQWGQVRQSLHAYADFAATADGTVRVDTQTPLKGTYTTAEPLALLRTGYRFGDPALQGVLTFDEAPLKSASWNRVWVKLERNGKVSAEASFELTDEAPGIEVVKQLGDGWHAVYAHPKAGEKLSVIISLHGSEGGSVGKARGRAMQLASNGFAAVGVNYFAYPHEAIQGIPTQHAEIKIEILESIREWLKSRPEVDIDRIHVVGVSKGAEFALIAASQFDWIKSTVAIVPSDVVWEGFSDGGSKQLAKSSWSVGGKPLPFVPLFEFDPKKESVYRTNTERYSRSRDFYPEQATQARIPVEKITGRVLLLAGDRDEVWASGDMSRNIVERMTAAGKADLVDVKIYPKAGHQIAGTGTFPVRLYGEQSSDLDAKDILAEGSAAADAWRRSIEFLSK